MCRSLDKVVISVYNMFNIDLRTFFAILSQNLLFTIIFVQVDLENNKYLYKRLIN